MAEWNQEIEKINWHEVGEQAVDYLKDYLKIDTSNPPGDVTQAAAFLKNLLEASGITVDLYESQPTFTNLVARIEGNGQEKPLLLLHHMDVVPADASKWVVAPFSAEIKDGYLWGRGTLDMKGMGIMQLMALLMMKSAAIPLNRDIIFIAVADEERGGERGTKWMVEQHYDKLEPEYVLDEGGIGFVDFFKTGPPVYFCSVTEKQSIFVRLTAKGERAPTSMPPKQYANKTLIKALQNILDYDTSIEITPVIQETFRRLAERERFPKSMLLRYVSSPIVKAMIRGKLTADTTMNAFVRNTISLTTLKAGEGSPTNINVIPSTSQATFDCRLLPGQSPEAFVEKLRQIINDDRVEVEMFRCFETPVISPYDSSLFQIIEKVIHRNTPGAITIPFISPGGTDSRFFRLKGANCYGLIPVALSRDELLIHKENERISLSEFKKGMKILFEIAVELCACPVSDAHSEKV